MLADRNASKYAKTYRLSSDIIGHEFKLHEHSRITVVDYMGSDDAILNAARTCYQSESDHPYEDDERLLRYLMRHRHTSPFECCRISLKIVAPLFVVQQFLRHRTAGLNQQSARYSVLPNVTYTPDVTYIKFQDGVNKQGGGDPVPLDLAETYREEAKAIDSVAFEVYEEFIAKGIARETCREMLPASTYTEMVWWMDLSNLMHFLELRMDKHAQKEIRDFANIIGNEIVAELFPVTWQAFLDYRLNAMTLTALDIAVINDFAANGWKQSLIAVSMNKGEKRECIEKLIRLGIIDTPIANHDIGRAIPGLIPEPDIADGDIQT